MNRRQHYAGKWDGKCSRCGHSYFKCRGNCTCLSCNAQRQGEARDGLCFEEDPESERNEAAMVTGRPIPGLTPQQRLRLAVDDWISLDRRRTQRALADAVGIHVSHLNEMIKGRRWFPGYVARLERELRVKIGGGPRAG